jgi:hypothetical protein
MTVGKRLAVLGLHRKSLVVRIHANVCLNQIMRNWSVQLNPLKRRRNGKFPQWMTQISNRKGYPIAIEFSD